MPAIGEMARRQMATAEMTTPATAAEAILPAAAPRLLGSRMMLIIAALFEAFDALSSATILFGDMSEIPGPGFGGFLVEARSDLPNRHCSTRSGHRLPHLHPRSGNHCTSAGTDVTSGCFWKNQTWQGGNDENEICCFTRSSTGADDRGSQWRQGGRPRQDMRWLS
jgi:hypothetical protein